MANVLSFGITPGSLAAGLSMEANTRDIEYVIRFDAPVDNSEEVLLVPQIPFPGSTFDFNETLKCTGITLTQEPNNHSVWRVRAQYDAGGMAIEEGKAYGFKIGVNPVNKAARAAYGKIVAGSSGEYVEDYGLETAVATIPIETSAGNPFAEPLTVIQHNATFSWWQIETVAVGDLINSGDYTKYLGTVNADSASFCGRTFDPGTLLLRGMEPEQYYYRSPYSTESEIRWKVTYTIEHNAEDWWDRVLDQDFEALLKRTATDTTLIKRPIRLADLPYNTSGTKVKLSDANDDYVQQPVKLDGAGELLEANASPVYLQYLVKRPLEWTELNLAQEIGR